MKIALFGAAGALANAVVRRLKEEGHSVQAVGCGPRSPRGEKNGGSKSRAGFGVSFGAAAGNGNAALIREALRVARVLVHLGWADAETEPLPSRVRRCLLPLGNLLSAAGEAASKIERLVLVSDARLYGEGSYTCPVNGTVTPQWRREENLRAHRWEHLCPVCGEILLPAPTSETHPAAPLSWSGNLVYAQERLALGWALERRIPVVALRYFELYGAETGSPAGKLASCALAGLPLEVSEDGGQTRDYIHLEDVARAASLAVRAPCRESLVLNVATGLQTSTLDFLACLERVLGKPLRIRANGHFDRTEARHLFARTAELARLGYRPPLGLQEGLEQFVESLLEARPKISQGRKP